MRRSWCQSYKKLFKCYNISTELDGSEDNLLFGYENLLGSVNDDEEIEDPNDQSSNEEYFEEDNYKNNWDIRNDANKIDNEIDNENYLLSIANEKNVDHYRQVDSYVGQ
ncbi:7056_t:CDS:2 [Funneliformis geosporum]|nr:7056_t:CDS:2 [Funneliformis geosporum]